MLATYQFMLINRKLLRSLWNFLVFLKLNYSRLVCQFSSHCTSWMDKIIQIFCIFNFLQWRWHSQGNHWFSFLVNWFTWAAPIHTSGFSMWGAVNIVLVYFWNKTNSKSQQKWLKLLMITSPLRFYYCC